MRNIRGINEDLVQDHVKRGLETQNYRREREREFKYFLVHVFYTDILQENEEYL